ncbi:hypothetical protein [Kangiella sp. TOML190]|uniref:hypothetical protein n=1 Tax=Kangiella sp. TOML190 TaxID=2931351 RepID=UPI00204250D8|nr:hypothetical protein [Kangiella sp. TOML190]
MVFSIRLLLLLIGLCTITACGGDYEAELLAERWSKHDWSQNQPELWLDINNDGEQERALVGFGTRTVLVAVLIEDEVEQVDFVEFFINKPSQQNALCSAKGQLAIEAQDDSLVEQFGENPEGFKSCQNCQGLVLKDFAGTCSPFHIYWDHKNQMLSWWRN